MCVVCGSFGQGAEGRLLACSQCGQCYHPYCVSIKVNTLRLSITEVNMLNVNRNVDFEEYYFFFFCDGMGLSWSIMSCDHKTWELENLGKHFFSPYIRFSHPPSIHRRTFSVKASSVGELLCFVTFGPFCLHSCFCSPPPSPPPSCSLTDFLESQMCPRLCGIVLRSLAFCCFSPQLFFLSFLCSSCYILRLTVTLHYPVCF